MIHNLWNLIKSVIFNKGYSVPSNQNKTYNYKHDEVMKRLKINPTEKLVSIKYTEKTKVLEVTTKK